VKAAQVYHSISGASLPRCREELGIRHCFTRPYTRATTAKPNPSSKPLCASGLTSATAPTLRNATSIFPHACISTISSVLMVASATLHLSPALPRKVQPIEGSQAARKNPTKLLSSGIFIQLSNAIYNKIDGPFERFPRLCSIP
jgi:hypothetical protein